MRKGLEEALSGINVARVLPADESTLKLRLRMQFLMDVPCNACNAYNADEEICGK